MNQPTTKYIENCTSSTQSYSFLSQDSTKYINSSVTTGTSSISISNNTSQITLHSRIFLSENSMLTLINDNSTKFSVTNLGKITASSLSGNGTKPLVADNDGNMIKSATAFSNTYNESRVLTEDRSNVSVTATQLGLTGTDLRTLPILAKVYFNDDDPSWVEFTQTVIIAETSVILWFPETLLSGRIVKICIFFGA